MKISLTPSFELTNEHSASSYGQLVLVNRDTGEAFGPADIIKPYPSWSYMPAAKAVERMAAKKKLTDEERSFVERFIKFGQDEARFTHKDLEGTWARLLEDGTLEMRDPNSGQGFDPEDKPRQQYRIEGWLLKTRRLPPAKIGDRWRGFIDEPWWEPVLHLPPGGIILDYWRFHAKGVRDFEYSSQAESAAAHVAAYTPNGRELRYVEGGGLEVQPANDNYWLNVPDLETAQLAYYHPEEVRS
jgi:hypothetical protein